MTKSERAYLVLAGIVAWAGLLLQLPLSIDRSPNVAFAISRMLAYFTVLTNLIVALYYTVRLLRPAAALTSWLDTPEPSRNRRASYARMWARQISSTGVPRPPARA